MEDRMIFAAYSLFSILDAGVLFSPSITLETDDDLSEGTKNIFMSQAQYLILQKSIEENKTIKLEVSFLKKAIATKYAIYKLKKIISY